MEVRCQAACPSSLSQLRFPWNAHWEMSQCPGWLSAGVPMAQRGLSLCAGVVHGAGAVPASCPLSLGLAHAHLSQSSCSPACLLTDLSLFLPLPSLGGCLNGKLLIC